MSDKLLRSLQRIAVTPADPGAGLESAIAECLAEICATFGLKAAMVHIGALEMGSGDPRGLAKVQEVPIMVGHSRAGSLTVYDEPASVHKSDEALALQIIGLQLGRVLEKESRGKDVSPEGHAETLVRAASSIGSCIRRQEDLLAVLDDAAEGIARLDPEGRYESVNLTYQRISGHIPAQIIGRSWKETVAIEDHPKMLAAIERMWAQGRAEVELRGLRADGQIYFKKVILRASFDRSGALCGYYKFSKDVSEEHELRRRLIHADRMAAVGTLAAGVAHEINNPMTYVLINLSLASEALRGQVDPDVYGLLNGAREGTERVRAIVRSLKSFSRMEEETLVHADVIEAIEFAIDMASNVLQTRATLVRNYGLAPKVRASEGRLIQVILNLLVNAAQAIPEGNVAGNRVEIATGLDEEGRVFIEVSDTGKGIPDCHLSRIFEPFFTTKPPGVGTGLGLSVCRSIITSFDGEILVSSAEGKGSRFRILLPAADAEEKPLRKNEEGQDCLLPASRRRGRILVIDDEAMIGRAIEKCLSCEHDVVLAHGGRAGLERLREDTRFDVVMCDLIMPGITGMEVYESVCGMSPELSGKFVFMTGGAFTPRSQEFLERVSAPWIEKPFELGSVRSLVESLVGAVAVT